MSTMPAKVRVRSYFYLASSAIVYLGTAVATSFAADERPFSESLRSSPAESLRARVEEEHARKLARQRRDEAAVGRFQRSLSKNPTTKYYYHHLAYSLRELGRYDQAIEICDRDLLLNPLDDYAYYILGTCYYDKLDYKNAAAALQQSIWLNPSNVTAYRSLGFSLYELRRHDEAASSLREVVKRTPKDFEANYWLGLSLFYAGRSEDAVQSLRKAVALRPYDFNANYWCGLVLVRSGHPAEAVAKLERANELQDSRVTQHLLFGCYLFVGQYGKAFRLFPVFAGVVGSTLMLLYLGGLVVLWKLGLRVSTAPFPPLRYAGGWTFLFLEGQAAFLVILALISAWKIFNNPLSGVFLSSLPLIAAAAMVFNRSAWGAPFRWPPSLGGARVVFTAFLLWTCSFLLNFAFAKMVFHYTGKTEPLQKAFPLLKEALRLSPTLAVLTIGFVVPLAEEILFRGLIFGALQKRLRAGWVIVLSSLIFALVHLEVVAFVPLFFFGVILGWARWKSGSIALPVLIHGLNNCLAIMALRL
jgi:membrane protease YdiL (CAAX protease family)/Flp pilus assembly protein TadD